MEINYNLASGSIRLNSTSFSFGSRFILLGDRLKDKPLTELYLKIKVRQKHMATNCTATLV